MPEPTKKGRSVDSEDGISTLLEAAIQNIQNKSAALQKCSSCVIFFMTGLFYMLRPTLFWSWSHEGSRVS